MEAKLGTSLLMFILSSTKLEIRSSLLMSWSSLLMFILSSTKLEIRAKQFLPGSEVMGGSGRKGE
jgi:hypothetical protein